MRRLILVLLALCLLVLTGCETAAPVQTTEGSNAELPTLREEREDVPEFGTRPALPEPGSLTGTLPTDAADQTQPSFSDGEPYICVKEYEGLAGRDKEPSQIWYIALDEAEFTASTADGGTLRFLISESGAGVQITLDGSASVIAQDANGRTFTLTAGEAVLVRSSSESSCFYEFTLLVEG